MTKEKAEAGFLFLYRLYWLYWCYGVFISALMSSSGVVIGAMPYFSTRRFRILGDKNAGREGPNGIKLRKSRITHSVVWDFFMEKY